MANLNPWKTILTEMALVLIGCLLFISHASPALARLLLGAGVLTQVFSLLVFLFNKLRRFW